MAIDNINRNEINLNQIFHKLLEWKIIIIIVTLLSVIMATYVAKSRPVLFKTSALIEIGEFTQLTFDFEDKVSFQLSPIEDANDLIRALKIKFNYANDNNINIYKREANLIQFDTKANFGIGTPLMNELIEYIDTRHKSIVEDYISYQTEIQKTKIKNKKSELQFYEEAKLYQKLFENAKNTSLLIRSITKINTKINFNKDLLAKETEGLVSFSEQKIHFLMREINNLDSRIKFNNLLLANETEMLLKKNDSFEQDSQQGLFFLQLQIASQEKSAKIFELTQKKIEAEVELESLQENLSVIDNSLLGNNIILSLTKENTFELQGSNSSLATIKDIKKTLFDLSLEKIELETDLILLQKNLTQIDTSRIGGATLKFDSEFLSRIKTLGWTYDHLELNGKKVRPGEIKNLSQTIFNLTQQKLSLEAGLKLFESRSQYDTKTSLIGGITSLQVYSKSLLIILFGFLSGLVLSIGLVFLISTFKNILKGSETK